MNWIDRVLQWADKYDGLPYWKIYKDKVGGNPYATSVSDGADFTTSMHRLKDSLGELGRGHYFLQLKKTFDSQAGNMTHEFDVTSEAVYAAINGINTPATIVAPDAGRYMTIEMAQKLTSEAIEKYAAEQDKVRLNKELAELGEKLRKAEHERDIAVKKSDNNRIDSIAGLVRDVKDVLPQLQGLLGRSQVALAGFEDQQPIPSEKAPAQQPAAQTEKTVQDHTAPGWDATDDRIHGAIYKLITMYGDGQVTPQSKTHIADLLEGLVGYKITNPGMFKNIEPMILEHKKYYPNE